MSNNGEARPRKIDAALAASEARGPQWRAERARIAATARWSGKRLRWALDTPAGIIGSWQTWAEGRGAAIALRAKYRSEGVKARVKLVRVEEVG